MFLPISVSVFSFSDINTLHVCYQNHIIIVEAGKFFLLIGDLFLKEKHHRSGGIVHNTLKFRIAEWNNISYFNRKQRLVKALNVLNKKVLSQTYLQVK